MIEPRLGPLSWPEYESFLTQPGAQGSTIYHHPLWLRTVEEGLGMRVVLLGLRQGSSLAGVMPGFIVRKGPIRLFGSPLRGSMTPHLGWILAAGQPPAGQALLNAVYRFCRSKLGCQYVETGFLNPPSELSEGSADGAWRVEHPGAYVLDLRGGEAQLWKNVSESGRLKVKQARKKGVVIEPVTEAAFMDEYFEILQKTFKRHGVISPHRKRFFEVLHRHFMPRQMMEVLAAKHEGRVISVGIFIHDGREIHFKSGASLAEFHHLRPNNLLHWHVISQSAARGLERYDLGGKGLASIDTFKETFGPRSYDSTTLWRAGALVGLARRMAVRALPHYQTLQYRASKLLRRMR